MRWFISLLFTFALSAAALAASTLDRLLSQDTAPAGVVIEVVEGDISALSWAFPKIENISEALHARFPDLPIAVVTHGTEQFGLAENSASPLAAKIRRHAKALSESSTALHVCGSHAEMRGVAASAFPDYVKVDPSGPAQITAYRNQGYELIILRKK